MELLARLAISITAAAATAGCFQPVYGDHSATTGGTSIAQALNAVDVLQIDAPTGTDDARIAVELRNDLLFSLQGGSGGGSPTHSLKIKVTASRYVASQDIQTGLSSSNIYSITATYQLTDLRTGKVVLNEKAYAPVSYDIPGEQQRFASARALRDSENRATQLVADNIRGRLASYFVAAAQPL